MTLQANADIDYEILPYLEWYAGMEGETYHEACEICQRPFVTCKNYQEATCVECSGIHNSWNKEKQRKAAREYERKNRGNRRKEKRRGIGILGCLETRKKGG